MELNLGGVNVSFEILEKIRFENLKNYFRPEDKKNSKHYVNQHFRRAIVAPICQSVMEIL